MHNAAKPSRRLNDLIEEARTLLEQIREDEQAAFDNLPDSFQAAPQGAKMEEDLSTLEDQINDLDNVHAEISGLINS